MLGPRHAVRLVFLAAIIDCQQRMLPQPAVQTEASAEGELISRQRQRVGTATFTQTPAGVRVNVQLFSLPRGRHAVHIHQAGRCDLPRFAAAGDHFAEPGQQNGMESSRGPHSGDLPNVVVAVDGFGSLSTVNPYVTLRPGANSLLRSGGTALIIHADPDDYRTDPFGNSGERIACGVIRSR